MMLDYLTLSIDPLQCSHKTLKFLEEKQNMLLCISGQGELLWRSPMYSQIRSDTHQISVQLGSTLDIWGSPARCMGDGKSNVFGSFDILECFQAMLHFVGEQTGSVLPCKPEKWKVRRVDVTGNYDLGGLDTVKQALNYLRHCEGGRYQVRTSAETVYWSKSSRLRAGKAYAKGPHMEFMVRKGKAELSERQLEVVQRLLRLELKLGSKFWNRDAGKPWYKFTSVEFNEVYTKYFKQFISNVEVSEVTDVLDKLLKIAPTQGMAKAAFKTWSLIQTHGHEATRELTGRSAWYKHKALLRQVGINWADMHNGSIVPFRRRIIDLGNPVTSWEDLEDRSDLKPGENKSAKILKFEPRYKSTGTNG